MEDWLVEDQATLWLKPINKKYMNFPPIGYGTLEPLGLEPQQVQPELVSSSIKLFKSRRKPHNGLIYSITQVCLLKGAYICIYNKK